MSAPITSVDFTAKDLLFIIVFGFLGGGIIALAVASLAIPIFNILLYIMTTGAVGSFSLFEGANGTAWIMVVVIGSLIGGSIAITASYVNKRTAADHNKKRHDYE